MRYINLRLTYLLTLLTNLPIQDQYVNIFVTKTNVICIDAITAYCIRNVRLTFFQSVIR